MNNAEKNMTSGLPKGVYPVMLTAFHEDGSLDFQGVDHLTDYYLQAGAAGLFACAMSAEVDHLDDQEKAALAKHIVQHVDARVPVVAGALSMPTLKPYPHFASTSRHSMVSARNCCDQPAVPLSLVSPPPYSNTSTLGSSDSGNDRS